MKKLVKYLSVTLLLTLISILSFGSEAKDVNWPEKPVIITVPWAVGGLADQANRALAQQGQKYLGQPIIPENKIGAGGIVALTEYLREKPNSCLLYTSDAADDRAIV